ncbi:MAG: hypothetical protein ACR2RE_05255 [Geminicoccaceae bacterium]
MTAIATCPSCHRERDLLPILSVLDFKTRQICLQCSSNNTETVDAITAAIDQGNCIPNEIWKSVKVYRDGAYLSLGEWMATRDAQPKVKPRLVGDEDPDLHLTRMRHILDLQQTAIQNAEPVKRSRPWIEALFDRLSFGAAR